MIQEVKLDDVSCRVDSGYSPPYVVPGCNHDRWGGMAVGGEGDCSTKYCDFSPAEIGFRAFS